MGQAAFEKAKALISREVMLAFPDFSQPFLRYTLMLVAVVGQNKKLIAFFSRKLNPAQRRYTPTECVLLAIVEILKEFRTTLLGHKIMVYTDHKNLTYTNFDTDCVMTWCLILEEYRPELIYTKGSTNIVADALSRLNTEPTKESIAEAKNFVHIREANAMPCEMEKRQVSVPHFDSTTFPITFSK